MQKAFFDVILIALLELIDVAGNLIADDFIEDFNIGTDTSFNQTYTGTLSFTANLNYDTEYSLYALAGSEVFGSTIPEPATLALMGLGLAGIGFARKRIAA